MMIPDFSNVRLLVVGDCMIDEYIDGTADRLSPEAPVAVVKQTGKRFYPGGAANVGVNAASIGAQVAILGVGNPKPKEMRDWSYATLIHEPARTTTRKTRIIANGMQVLRLDREQTEPISHDTEESLLSSLTDLAQRANAIIVSDYAKGCITPRVFKAILSTGKPVFVGAKQHLGCYDDASWIVLNAAELSRFMNGRPAWADEQIRDLCREASMLTEASILVTRGSEGMFLYDSALIAYPPIRSTAREVFDVSGAGDTVLATFACAITAGMKPLDAATLANAAAGIVVGKRGTATVGRNELQMAIVEAEVFGEIDPPINDLDRYVAMKRGISPEDARGIAAQPLHPKVIGFANGCFDLLHAGHVSLLQRARAQCDYLIVAINDDASVRRLKGPGRPVWNDIKRAAMLRALDCVDTVLTFHEDTPLSLIELLRPKALFRGEEYLGDGRPAPTVGSEEVRSWGGKLVILPKLEGYSTSSIIERMKA